jgi:hypothetical protein
VVGVNDERIDRYTDSSAPKPFVDDRGGAIMETRASSACPSRRSSQTFAQGSTTRTRARVC